MVRHNADWGEKPGVCLVKEAIMCNLDGVDYKISGLLQSNAMMTLKDIASTVYLTSPAVSARIDKLERNGIIIGYHAQVNTEAVARLCEMAG